jgi:two-component sensor histidine kinase
MTLKWQEICVAHANRGPVGEDGFGSRMINLSLAQLCGKSVRDWNPAGLQISLVLPIDNHGALKGRNAPED